MVEGMVKVKAYLRLEEIHRFEISPSSSYAMLSDKVRELFGRSLYGIGYDINYYDKVGNCITIKTDEILKRVFSDLDGGETLHLKLEVLGGERLRMVPSLTYDLPDVRHHLDYTTTMQHYEKIKSDLQKKAELAQYHAMCQANVDVKRSSASASTRAPASGGEVAEKKAKAVCRGFESWQPKEEKGLYTVITYGPVGYEIHYTHDEQEGTKPEETKTGDDHQEKKPAEDKPETKLKMSQLFQHMTLNAKFSVYITRLLLL